MTEWEPVDEAVRHHDLAVAHAAAGRLQAAATASRHALEMLERHCGAGHPDVANVLNTLGFVHVDLAEYAEAQGCFERAVAILQALPADQDVLVRLRVQSLGHLANVHRILGRWSDAEAGFRGALELAEEALGPDDGDVSSLLNGLAMVYKYTARFDEARRLYDRALRIAEDTSGPTDPAVASIFHNLGGLEHARGRPADGEPYARRSVEIREAALGPDHPAVAADVAALAALVEDQGRLDEAAALYERALAVFERTLGPDHYEVAVTCNNLGAVAAAHGDSAEAERRYRKALRLKEALLGPDHPDVAVTCTTSGCSRSLKEQTTKPWRSCNGRCGSSRRRSKPVTLRSLPVPTRWRRSAPAAGDRNSSGWLREDLPSPEGRDALGRSPPTGCLDDDRAICDSGVHRRHLVGCDRDHDFVQQRHAGAALTPHDQTHPLSEPRHRQQVRVVESLADGHRGKLRSNQIESVAARSDPLEAAAVTRGCPEEGPARPGRANPAPQRAGESTDRGMLERWSDVIQRLGSV